jgi:hypothetical protein
MPALRSGIDDPSVQRLIARDAADRAIAATVGPYIRYCFDVVREIENLPARLVAGRRLA